MIALSAKLVSVIDPGWTEQDGSQEPSYDSIVLLSRESLGRALG